MKIDINKIIHLELRNKHGKKFSNTRLRFIAEFLSINSDFLVDLSDDYDNIWFVNTDVTTIVFATFGVSAYSFQPFNLEYAAVKDIKAVEVPRTPSQTKKSKVVKTNEVSKVFIEDLIGDVDLDVDSILDKISASGMTSLTKRELEFLNSLNK